MRGNLIISDFRLQISDLTLLRSAGHCIRTNAVKSSVIFVLLFLVSCSGSNLTDTTGGKEDKPQPHPEQIKETEISFPEVVTQITFSQTGDDKDPEISPDGNHLFYSTTAYSKDYDIYRKEIGSTSSISVIASNGTDERFPSINPANPNMIAFSSNRSGRWHIYIIMDYTVANDEWIQITEGDAENIHPSFNYDGTKLVFSTKDGDRWKIKIYDLHRYIVIAPEQLEGLVPEFHPKENLIVFQKMRKTQKWFSEIWTCKVEGEKITDVTSLFASKEWAAINPSWLNDGKQIIFCSAVIEDEKDKDKKEIKGLDLYTIDSDGKNLKQLVSNKVSDWMPKGYKDKVYFISDRIGNYRVFSLSIK